MDNDGRKLVLIAGHGGAGHIGAIRTALERAILYDTGVASNVKRWK